MRQLIAFLALSLFFTTCLAWELKKDSKGIKVYTQDIEGSSFKAFRGETTIAASLREIISNHIDVESMSEWLKDCAESELLTQLSKQEFLVYQRTDAPWPVSDRDYVMKATISQDPISHIVTMNFEAIVEANKHDDECVRVTKLNGFWRFTPSEKGEVLVEYETHADPSGDIPAWLANSFVVDQPFDTLKNLKNRIQNKEHTEIIKIDFIKEPDF